MIVHDIQNSCSPVKILMGFFISSAVSTGYYYTIIGHKQYTSVCVTKSNSIFNSKVGRIGLFPFTAPFKNMQSLKLKSQLTFALFCWRQSFNRTF